MQQWTVNHDPKPIEKTNQGTEAHVAYAAIAT